MRLQSHNILLYVLCLFGYSIGYYGEQNIIDSLTFKANPNPLIIRAKAPTYKEGLLSFANQQPSYKSDNPKSCQGMICFVYSKRGVSIFDCQKHIYPFIRSDIISILECSIWKSASYGFGQTANRFFEDSSKNFRIRVRPKNMDINGAYPAMKVDMAEPNALLRLCKNIQRQHPEALIKLSIIKLQIKHLNYQDLALLFSDSVVTNLILWNPKFLEETSLLTQEGDKISDKFIKISFYCETKNDEPAFKRLWIPWNKWQFKFHQCKGKYDCHLWPVNQKICLNTNKCPQIPHSVIIQANKLLDSQFSSFNNYAIQTISHNSCPLENSITNSLAELIYRQNYWKIPRISKINPSIEKQKNVKISQAKSQLLNKNQNLPENMLPEEERLFTDKTVGPFKGISTQSGVSKNNEPDRHLIAQLPNSKLLETETFQISKSTSISSKIQDASKPIRKNDLLTMIKKKPVTTTPAVIYTTKVWTPTKIPFPLSDIIFTKITKDKPFMQNRTNSPPKFVEKESNNLNAVSRKRTHLNKSELASSTQSFNNETTNNIHYGNQKKIFITALVALLLLNVFSVTFFTCFYCCVAKKWKTRKQYKRSSDLTESKNKLLSKNKDWVLNNEPLDTGDFSDATIETNEYTNGCSVTNATVIPNIWTSLTLGVPPTETTCSSLFLKRLFPKTIFGNKSRPHTIVLSGMQSPPKDDKRSHQLHNLRI